MIKNLKLQLIYVDPSDNPRVDYSALPAIQDKIESQGFDPSFPVQVVKYKGPNGETHKLVGGFTRHKAATALKLEEVPCIVRDYTPEQIIVNHITSNSGNPLNQFEQGKVFIQYRDYGTDPDKIEKGEVVREKPRSLAEIAKAFSLSSEHVRNCITIAESPKEIRELLESGKVSANAVIDASKGVKDAKTVRKILLAATEAAGGVQATNKHVKEVKGRFVELKGKTGKETSKAAPVAAEKIESGDAVTVDDGKVSKLKPLTVKIESKSEDPNVRDRNTFEGETTECPDPQPSLIESKSPKRDQLISLIAKWDEKHDLGLSDEEMDDLADVLVDVF